MDERLEQARKAIRTREYYSAFPESPSPRVYGESAAAEGRAAFDAHRKRSVLGEHPGRGRRGGSGSVAVRASSWMSATPASTATG